MRYELPPHMRIGPQVQRVEERQRKIDALMASPSFAERAQEALTKGVKNADSEPIMKLLCEATEQVDQEEHERMVLVMHKSRRYS